MRRIRIAFRTTLFVILFGFFNYVLPQQDVARIVSTNEIRVDFSWFNRPFYAQADSGSEELPNRHVRFINTERKRTVLFGLWRTNRDGIMVYRNEDTGWIWPPYFKFDSQNLKAEADAALSTPDNTQWVIITHYGWRYKLATIHPNAISIRKIDSPDIWIIPWFNIIFFALMILGYFLIRAMWRQFRERKIDPVLEDVSDAAARVGDGVSERKGRISRWLDTWRSKPKR